MEAKIRNAPAATNGAGRVEADRIVARSPRRNQLTICFDDEPFGVEPRSVKREIVSAPTQFKLRPAVNDPLGIFSFIAPTRAEFAEHAPGHAWEVAR